MFVRETCLVEAESISCSGIVLNGHNGYVITHASLLVADLEKSPVVFKKLCDIGYLAGSELPAWPIHVTFELRTEAGWQADSDVDKEKFQPKQSPLNFRTAISRSAQDCNPSQTPIKCYGTVQAIWKSEKFSDTLSSLFPGSDSWKFHEGTEVMTSDNNTQTMSSTTKQSSTDPYCISNQQSSTGNPQQVCNPQNITTLLPYFVLIKTNQTINGTDEYILSKSRARQWPAVKFDKKLILGEPLGVIGTPFGNLSPRVFMNSLSKGVVSNVAGPDGELILTDARCIPGTEGAAVVIPESGGLLLGMVVAPLCWRSNEWIGLSICCRINEIFESFQLSFQQKVFIQALETFSDLKTPKPSNPSRVLANPVTNSFPVFGGQVIECVLIKNKETWGSGALIDNSLVITCSHVVRSAKQVKVRIDSYGLSIWDDADVVYATPEGHIYDLAVLDLRPKPSLPSTSEKGFQAGSYIKKVGIRTVRHPRSEEWLSRNVSFESEEGDDVHMIGHAAFSPEREMPPSVTSGIISRIIYDCGRPAMLQTTCAVHSGASGGPLFNVEGKIVGMVVCNAKDTDSGASYPHVNLAVPVEIFWPAVVEYFATYDATVFKTLQCNDKAIQRLWSLENEANSAECTPDTGKLRSKL